MPLPRPTEDDAMLLEELMNGPPLSSASSMGLSGAAGGGAAQFDSAGNVGGAGGFAAQWDKMMAASSSSTGAAASAFGQEFGDFVGASSSSAAGQDMLAPEGQKGAAATGDVGGGGFLPSQLFDRDQSFHPASAKGMPHIFHWRHI